LLVPVIQPTFDGQVALYTGLVSTSLISAVRNRLGDRKTGPVEKCRRSFLKFFPRGFKDPKYFEWERGYKLAAHEDWQKLLNRANFRALLKTKRYVEIAAAATRIESRTNLLFSFEKMALRDAVKQTAGAKIFAEGLWELLYGKGSMGSKFDHWCEAVGSLPRKQTRVLTHPVVTIFPFVADPTNHIFLKPNTTKRAAQEYGFDLTNTGICESSFPPLSFT